MKIFAFLASAAFIFLTASPAASGIYEKTVEYKQGDTVLEGYVVYDETKTTKRPAVLIVHDWMGPGEFVHEKALLMAKLGYVAFVADIYGKGVRPKDMNEAAAQAGKYKADRNLLRLRAKAALDYLRGVKYVDTRRIAAIGYCFGGTTVLEIARSGQDIAGVVSIHGGLDTLPGETNGGKNISAKVLVLNGADDPYSPPDVVNAFQDEMRRAGADWQIVMYGCAVHSFTNPKAGGDNSKGAAYNEKADKRSWTALMDFFDEIFK